MSAPFAILAVITVVSALGATLLKNPVHCVLSLTVTFAGMAGLFLQMNAQFIGLVQILVYVGAVAVLVVFALLLTRSSGTISKVATFSKGAWLGGIVAVALFAVLASAIGKVEFSQPAQFDEQVATVRSIGTALVSEYILPLEVMGLLLTAAAIGGIVIAMEDRAK